MITKTYLDGRLNELEEKLKKRIDIKDNRQNVEIKEDIDILKDKIRSIEEKVDENNDLLNNYLIEHNSLKEEIQKIQLKSGNIENQRSGSSDTKQIDEDEIISDF